MRPSGICGAGRDADQDRGERAADQKLGDRDAEQLQGDRDRGQAAEQDDGVADDGSVRGAELRLQDLVGPPGQPGRAHGREQAERHRSGVRDRLGAGVAERP